jgi:hypothetical protein
MKILKVVFKYLFCEGLREFAVICESTRNDIQWAIQDSKQDAEPYSTFTTASISFC